MVLRTVEFKAKRSETWTSHPFANTVAAALTVDNRHKGSRNSVSSLAGRTSGVFRSPTSTRLVSTVTRRTRQIDSAQRSPSSI
jgi:hypothetical protein